ncbi:YIP1 family protein [Leptospira fletcheri]|uniref:YIP1 family protein n=1 Tax=Leptospira fletcheri TaxID=2484981 RepID=A0A4R9GCP6_9LEPT|nr:YIP1 family protein [Leptospira fletcheri]TGK08950.1 YIP1 family protein [Leptospira fletcheri]
MKILIDHVREVLIVLRSPSSAFQSAGTDPNFLVSFLRVFFFFLIGSFVGGLFSLQSAAIFLAFGGSFLNFLFIVLLPSVFWGAIYSALYSGCFLLIGGILLYWIPKYSRGLTDVRKSATFVSRLAFLFPLCSCLYLMLPAGRFRFTVLILFFLYSSYLLLNVLYYGLKCERRNSFISSLAVGSVSLFLFFWMNGGVSQDLFRPSYPKSMTPEEEKEKIQEAKEVIERLEKARREKGLSN